MNGKGDRRRPQQVSYKQFNDNWDRIFNKKVPAPTKDPWKAVNVGKFKTVRLEFENPKLKSGAYKVTKKDKSGITLTRVKGQKNDKDDTRPRGEVNKKEIGNDDRQHGQVRQGRA